MANVEKTVEIIFGATDNASNVFSNIESSVNTFSSNVTQPLSAAGDAALKAETAIVGLGVAFLGVAVNESAQFNTALNEIGTLFNATPDEVKKLGDEVKAFGVDSVFSLEDVNSSLYDMVSATGDVDGAVEGLASAQDLATVAGTSLGTSVNSLTTVLNSYGQSMTEADGVSDALFITVQNGKTTLGELDANLGKVTSTASAAGVPFDDLGAAVAALTGAGNDTASSMTQLQALIKELADPTADLETAMGGLSLETDGLKPVMDALKESTGGNFVEMNALFGSVEATKGALVLANDASGTFAGTMQAMADKAGVVSENMKLMEKNLDLVTQNMKTNLNLSMIAIGDQLQGEWTGIVSSLSDLFKGTNIALDNGAFDEVFSGLNQFQSALSTYLTGIAEALPAALDGVDFSGLVDSFGGLGDAIGGIFGDLDFTKAEDLKIGIQFVVDSFTSLNNVVTGIVQAWTPAIQFIAGTIETFNSTGDSAQILTGNILGASQIFETFKSILPGFGTALVSIKDIFEAISTIKMAGAVTSLGTALGGLPLDAASAGLGRLVTAMTGPTGMVIAAGLAGVALGTLAKDGIDSLIQTATGVEGATLGTWIYDVLNESEGTTAINLQKVEAQIVKMNGFDYQFTDKILEILNAETTGESTAELLLDIESALGDLSAIDANKISQDVLAILEADLTGEATDTALEGILTAANGLKDGLPAAESAVRDFDKEVADAADSAITWEDEIGKALDTIGSMEGILEGATGGMVAQKDAANDLEKIWQSLGGEGGTAAEFSKATADLYDSLSDPDGVYTEAEINIKNWIEKTALQKTAAENVIVPLSELEQNMGELTEASRLAAEQAHDTELKLLDLASNEQIAAAQAIVELEKQLLQLASNEKIAAMKFTAEINVAEINAQAKQIEAAYSATAAVIDSLTEGVTSLYSIFASVGEGDRISKTAQAILDAAKRQEGRLDDELAQKKALNEATLELMRIQAEALTQESIITIDSDGLDQYIEAFMFEVLKKIQLKIAGSRSAFLLGAGL